MVTARGEASRVRNLGALLLALGVAGGGVYGIVQASPMLEFFSSGPTAARPHLGHAAIAASTLRAKLLLAVAIASIALPLALATFGRLGERGVLRQLLGTTLVPPALLALTGALSGHVWRESLRFAALAAAVGFAVPLLWKLVDRVDRYWAPAAGPTIATE